MNKEYLKKYYLRNKKALSKTKALWYKKNRVRLLEKNKVYSRENREKINAKRKEYKTYGVRYTERYKEKQKVRRSVRYAISKGVLIRLPCIKCGDTAHAHHEDYTKALDVVWLCRKHHNERHREMLLLSKIIEDK